VEVALQHDRPALFEVVGILALCAVLLAGLAKMDNSAARQEAQRAHAVLAARAAAEARKPKGDAESSSASSNSGKNQPVTARTESLGSRGPIAIPVGAAWSPGTSASVAHSRPVNNPPKAPDVPTPDLRRIVGPITASEPVPVYIAPENPVDAKAPSRTEKRDRVVTATKHAAVPTARTPASPSMPFRLSTSLVLAIMAACGLLMCVGGLSILRRA
jgi:hypothetical protein